MGEIEIKLGELLRLERERRGISLEDLSSQLKISEKNLRCIETGDVSSLPSPLYFNLFAKSYCEALGIDHARTLEAIQLETPERSANGKTDERADTAALDDREKRSPAARRQGEPGELSEKRYIKKLIFLFGGIVVVFIAFIIVFQLLSDEEAARDEPAADQQAVEEATQSVSRPKDTDSGTTYDWNVAEYEKPQPLKLRLIPRAESWATILADGDTAIFRNLVPGRLYNVEAAYRLQISVGIPRVVDIELNGKPLDIVNPETKRISRVIINQMNLAQFMTPPPRQVEPTMPQPGAVTSESGAPSTTPDSSDEAGGA